MEFIDAQFEAYLQEELKIKRTLHNYHDTRIHACLYFIAPTGHSLKSLDLVTMKKLDSKVSNNFIEQLPPAGTVFGLFIKWNGVDALSGYLALLILMNINSVSIEINKNGMLLTD